MPPAPVPPLRSLLRTSAWTRRTPTAMTLLPPRAHLHTCRPVGQADRPSRPSDDQATNARSQAGRAGSPAVGEGIDVRADRPALSELGQLQPSVSKARALKRPAGVPKVLSQAQYHKRKAKGVQQDDQYERVQEIKAKQKAFVQQSSQRGLSTFKEMLRYWVPGMGMEQKKTSTTSLWESWKGIPAEKRLILVGCMTLFAIGGIFYSEYMEDEYPPTELEQKELKDAFNKVGKFVGLGPHPEDPPPEARPEAVPAA